MATRVQVPIADDRYREIRRIARLHGTSVAAWVRSVLDEAVGRELRSGAERKRAVIRRAARYRFPAPPIEQMVAEIEKACGGGDSGIRRARWRRGDTGPRRCR